MNESPAAQQQASSAPDDALPGFRRSAWVLIVAAVALHAAMIFRAEPLQSANDRSRWCTIWSLLNRRSYQIDEIRERPGWSTIDLVRVDGHFYSTKPPLMSTWVAGVTWAMCRITGWNLDEQLEEVNVAVLLIVNALPFAISLWLLARLLAQECRSEWAAWFVLATASFGTLLSPFLTTLNNHTVAAAGVMVAISCWFSKGDKPRAAACGLALWGFSSGWAACHDLPAAAFALWMALCAWRRTPRGALTIFLPALLVTAIAFLATNYAATGTLKPTYSNYGGDSYRFVHEGVPSYWTAPQGIDRNLDSPPAYLFHCVFGHHGWFSLTPVWLLIFIGIVPKAPSESGSDLKRSNTLSLALGAMALTAVVLGFYFTRTENYNYGGVSCGLRWALFLTPLWTVALIPAVERCALSRWSRGLALTLLAASIYSAWEPIGHAWRQPWLFRELESHGWINYRDRPPELPRPFYSWIASLPEAGAMPVYVELQRITPTAEDERLRLEWSQPDQQIGSRRCAVIDITRSQDKTIQSRRTLLIDREAFNAGHAPAACLVWTDATTTAAQQQADLALFRGLPLLQAYRPGFIRYMKSSLRSDALPCQRIAAQVHDPKYSPFVFRSDVWLCDELPFGVARVDWTVSQPDTAAIVQQESWQVVDCSPPVAPVSSVTVDHLPPFRNVK
jgi:hypothetical protein